MRSLDVLLMLTAAAASLSSMLRIRVASSSALIEAARLDGTERLFERRNRRVLATAAIASLVTILLASAAYMVAR